MKTKVILSIIAVPALLIGCATLRNQTVSADKYRELVSQTCLSIPESQMTFDQMSMKIKVLDYVYANTMVKDNKQYLSVTRRQLKKAGIPAVYYDVLQFQHNETNSFVARELKNRTLPAEVLDMEKLVAEAKTRYFETERPELLSRLERLR